MKVVDMHCDTELELYHAFCKHEDRSLLENDGHIDLRKLQQGDYLLQNFAMFVNLKREKEPFLCCMAMIENFKKHVQTHKDLIRLVSSYAEMEQGQKDQMILGMLTVEEGGVLEGDMNHLYELYHQGVRMMTLTWNYQNELAGPNGSSQGLTDFGREVVQEMNRLGIIVDVSHLSDAGFDEVASLCKGPFVASHSNARELCHHQRNLTDRQIRTIANAGGVIGLNFEGEFLRDVTPTQPLYSKLDVMVAHIRHMINVGGEACVGLGSDFDGINTPQDLKDASLLPMLEQALLKENIPYSTIEHIFYKNCLRVYKDVL